MEPEKVYRHALKHEENPCRSQTLPSSPSTPPDRSEFIRKNQDAFRYGALEEFGTRDEHFEEEGEIISSQTIQEAIDAKGAETYWITENGKKAGGVVLEINKETNRNQLVLFFTDAKEHGKGIGYAAWLAVEALHPKQKSGKPIRPTSKHETSISTSTNADSVPSNSSTRTTATLTARKQKKA